MATATHAFSAAKADELSLTVGDKVAVLDQPSEGGWWHGRLLARAADGACADRTNSVGWFPESHVVIVALGPDEAATLNTNTSTSTNTNTNTNTAATTTLTTASTTATTGANGTDTSPSVGSGLVLAQGKATHTFSASKADELSFEIGDAIAVLDQPSEGGWWRGRNVTAAAAAGNNDALNVVGWFPENHVALGNSVGGRSGDSSSPVPHVTGASDTESDTEAFHDGFTGGSDGSGGVDTLSPLAKHGAVKLSPDSARGRRASRDQIWEIGATRLSGTELAKLKDIPEVEQARLIRSLCVSVSYSHRHRWLLQRKALACSRLAESSTSSYPSSAGLLAHLAIWPTRPLPGLLACVHT
jgi:hypothetical protein